MPRSRRNKTVHLTRTAAKGTELKNHLLNTVRDNVDIYAYAYVFSFDNMRTSFFKDVRKEWRDRGRFFLGKLKVIRRAFINDDGSAYRPGLPDMGEELYGSSGLLFTDAPPSEVVPYFEGFTRVDYARTGAIASRKVVLPGGVLEGELHSNLEMLRKLGLSVALKKGIIHLESDHVVCKPGKVLTAEQARLLKHFKEPMAEFQMSIIGYCNEGAFVKVGGDAAME